MKSKLINEEMREKETVREIQIILGKDRDEARKKQGKGQFPINYICISNALIKSKREEIREKQTIRDKKEKEKIEIKRERGEKKNEQERGGKGQLILYVYRMS